MSGDHSHDHGHEHGGAAHSHVPASTPARRLTIALGLTASFMVVEIVAGWLTGSLALLFDAGHMLTDAAAVAHRIREVNEVEHVTVQPEAPLQSSLVPLGIPGRSR